MNPEVKQPSEFEAALAAGRAMGTVLTPTTPSDVVIVPQGYVARSLEDLIAPHQPRPRRIRQSVKMDTLDSFCEYVHTYNNGFTKVFVRAIGTKPPTMMAIIDYHANDERTVCAAWCEHRVTYEPGFSEEWTRWMSKAGVRMSQVDFATFLEENQTLIAKEDESVSGIRSGAELLELVQELQGRQDVSYNTMIRLNNGKNRLLYTEDVELKGVVSTRAGEFEFPTSLTVAIAPFVGGPAYKITARLRYRIESRKLVFWFEMVDLHIVLADSVKDMVDRMTEKTGISPFFGTL